MYAKTKRTTNKLTCLVFLTASVIVTSMTANAANLVDAYQDAKENDPVLGGAIAQYEARKELVPQTRASLLPNITAGGTSSWNQRDFPARIGANRIKIPQQLLLKRARSIVGGLASDFQIAQGGVDLTGDIRRHLLDLGPLGVDLLNRIAQRMLESFELTGESFVYGLALRQ